MRFYKVEFKADVPEIREFVIYAFLLLSYFIPNQGKMVNRQTLLVHRRVQIGAKLFSWHIWKFHTKTTTQPKKKKEKKLAKQLPSVVGVSKCCFLSYQSKKGFLLIEYLSPIGVGVEK